MAIISGGVSVSMVKAACLAMLVAAFVAVEIEAAAPPQVSCGTVVSTLAPCFEYILGGGAVPINCCNGVKSLYRDSSTTAQRRNVCRCLKDVTRSASTVSVKNAEALPGKCGVSVPYEISPSIDCNKVN